MGMTPVYFHSLLAPYQFLGTIIIPATTPRWTKVIKRYHLFVRHLVLFLSQGNLVALGTLNFANEKIREVQLCDCATDL